ncbi:hypothetical protein ATG98_3560 [Marinobacter sp. LV10R520-4]|uniref:hypothetical protein n=1 Tax=Marinobacter sp. LV10R520-4 TaxID=1761796 RepID=UPI000C015A15|nr:hypothetical protein [Marinobacter sp. LV10R520-4]PFG54335.1 hypothetical protein ATG98_3560 [Marinobacter sp. LV10R520-4]
MTTIEVIREWMRLTNQQFVPQRKPCTEFNDLFFGYFPEEFLATSYYVIVPHMPVPAHKFLVQHGLTDLFNRDLAGLTLNDTYYLIPTHENDLQIHFHELVRVAQWHHWGFEGFIARYLEELKNFGYDNMPLERMAHDLGGYYTAGDALVNVPRIIEALK